jgi:hypothetical protein
MGRPRKRWADQLSRNTHTLNHLERNRRRKERQDFKFPFHGWDIFFKYVHFFTPPAFFFRQHFWLSLTNSLCQSDLMQDRGASFRNKDEMWFCSGKTYCKKAFVPNQPMTVATAFECLKQRFPKCARFVLSFNDRSFIAQRSPKRKFKKARSKQFLSVLKYLQNRAWPAVLHSHSARSPYNPTYTLNTKLVQKAIHLVKTHSNGNCRR